MIEKEPFETTCADGVVLRGVLIKPEQPKAVVQFNGGVAAKKEFYQPFLTYLAASGYLCCSWDYRGSGDSAPEAMSSCEYQYRDYGLQDMPAIRRFLRARYPQLPLLLYAHSVGGQQVGFSDGLEDYKGMVGFAVSTGYLPAMPWRYKLVSYPFFYLFTPLSIALAGYLRARKFGYMEDLPRKVVLEWRSWCTKRDYFFDKQFAGKTVPVKRYAHLPFPVHIFWTADDPIGNRANVSNFWKHVNSQYSLELEELTLEEMGGKKLEHFGFFHRRVKDICWPRGLAKLDAFLKDSGYPNRQ